MGVLVTVFREVLMSDMHGHLKNFFLIVPALIVNFVETSIAAKDSLHKKGRESYFTDDGFALGIACVASRVPFSCLPRSISSQNVARRYVLAMLQQWRHFDALHFFDAI